MKIYFNLNSQWSEKVEFFFKETCDFQIVGNETITLVSYRDMKISVFLIDWLKSYMKMVIYTQIILDIHSNSFIQKCKFSIN